MKLIFISAGWYTLFWILKKVIALLTGLEAAEILAGFITWAAGLVLMALRYSGACAEDLAVSLDSQVPATA